MNDRDIEIFCANFEIQKNRATRDNCGFRMDVSSTCIFSYWTDKLKILKYQHDIKSWVYKMVYGWTYMTIDEFFEQFDKQDWVLNNKNGSL